MDKRLVNYTLSWKNLTNDEGTTENVLLLSVVDAETSTYALDLHSSKEAQELIITLQRARILLELEEQNRIDAKKEEAEKITFPPNARFVGQPQITDFSNVRWNPTFGDPKK